LFSSVPINLESARPKGWVTENVGAVSSIEAYDEEDYEYALDEESLRRSVRTYSTDTDFDDSPVSLSASNDASEDLPPGTDRIKCIAAACDSQGEIDFEFPDADDQDELLLEEGEWDDGWVDDSAPLSIAKTRLDTDWELLSDDVFAFEEAPTREELQEVRTTTSLTREERARESALKMGAAIGWDTEEILVLQQIFVTYPWGATKGAVQRQIDFGVTPEELRLAYEIRLNWQRNPEYSASFGSYPHCVLSWPLAVDIVKSFRGYPELEEIETFLWELHMEWYSSARRRRDFLSFRDYLKARLGLFLNDQLCNGAVDWTCGMEDTAWECESTRHAGRNNPELVDLASYGLLPQRPENIYQRVGGINWGKHDGVECWAAPHNYFARLRRHSDE
jgi:hypothetical protein